MRMPTLTLDLTATADYRAFLDAIIREPECDTHRLVIADWLEERGDEAWGEFIRVGCELAKMGPPHKVAGFDDTGPVDFHSGGPDYWVFRDYFERAAMGERIDVKMRSVSSKTRVRHGLLVTRVPVS